MAANCSSFEGFSLNTSLSLSPLYEGERGWERGGKRDGEWDVVADIHNVPLPLKFIRVLPCEQVKPVFLVCSTDQSGIRTVLA